MGLIHQDFIAIFVIAIIVLVYSILAIVFFGTVQRLFVVAIFRELRKLRYLSMLGLRIYPFFFLEQW